MSEYRRDRYWDPWISWHYAMPASSRYAWGRLFDPSFEQQEKTLYLLVGQVLVKMRFEGQQGTDYARLSCTVLEVDGVAVPEEKRAPRVYEERRSPTPDEEQEVLRAALEACGVPMGPLHIVSDAYVEGHLKILRLRQRILAKQKGAGPCF